MNILLPTYSYYPYKFGGTEVYVSGLANFLKQQGHAVTIIAGMPPEAFNEHPVFYEDNEIQTVQYTIDEIVVIGVINKNLSTEEIYTKYRFQWVASWLNILKKLPQNNWDILHFHAFTSAIGHGILEAVKQHSCKVKIAASYHLPISCLKNTLLYGNTLKDCAVSPSANNCTACFINSNQKVPMFLSRLLSRLMPVIENPSIHLVFKLKYLVSQSINSFNKFNAAIHQWYVFSTQIEQVLLLNNVAPNNIIVLQHGVDIPFLTSQFNKERRNTLVTKFLYVGRFEKVKGLFLLLQTWCNMEESTTKQLEIIGESLVNDEELNALIKRASKRKDIIWHGRKNRVQIAAIMQNIHCTIIPSEWVEIGPLVFHEAISCGSDVIAADIGGCKALSSFYNEKSSLFKVANSQSLRKAILNFKYSNVERKVISQDENYSSVLFSYSKLVSIN